MKVILFGKPVATKIYQDLEGKIKDLKRKPFLAVILVGENPASLSYIKIKEEIAERLGIGFKLYHYPAMALPGEVEKLIQDLNQNQNVSGIVVQLPLPEHIKTEKIIQSLSPEKDVDGFKSSFPAPTAQAILEILKFYQIEIKNLPAGRQGKNIVIVGHGRLVGGPLEKILQKQNIQATICDLKTPNLGEKTLSADILVSAVGASGLIKPAMVKSETIIIDAGTSEVGGKIVGDVSPEVYQKVSTYTPNPGGVGPVTVACLMKNVVDASKKQYLNQESTS